MKAMIFAAGKGTRLRPLTDDRPKALVEVKGKPLLYYCIENLKRAGVTDIIINVHHFADSIEAYLHAHQYFGLRVALSDERDVLLDTGGGLKEAAWFFADGQPFFVHNVDIFSNIDLDDIYNAHVKSGAVVTLACNKRESSRYFLLDDDLRLCGWKNIKTGERIIRIEEQKPLQQLAFGGIHVIDPVIFTTMPAEEKFSIVDYYLQLAPQALIQAYTGAQLKILDVGKPQQLAAAAEFIGDRPY